jgi:hypothetical protein
VRRSEEDEDRAISQAHYKALECAKTAPAVSEKARTRIVEDYDNRIQARELQAAERKAAQAQAAMTIVQQSDESLTLFSKEKKKPSKEKKEKEETKAGSKTDDKDKSDKEKRRKGSKKGRITIVDK